jgi:hypothetical protein
MAPVAVAHIIPAYTHVRESTSASKAVDSIIASSLFGVVAGADRTGASRSPLLAGNGMFPA